MLGMEDSNFRHCSTIGAEILHVGKSPGLRLQVVPQAMKEDSISWRLGFSFDL